jgi:hypothetical protein
LGGLFWHGESRKGKGRRQTNLEEEKNKLRKVVDEKYMIRGSNKR